jgi:hypothetical protein
MRTQSLALLAGGLVVAFAGSGIALANPGQTGKSGVTFGGGVPSGSTPGPAAPTRPTQPSK